MTYLKRFLWLAAWSVWLWLGFGLYRELPRDLGPVVCKLQLEEREHLYGLMEGDLAVTRLDGEVGDSFRYRVWNASSGRLLHDWKGPIWGYTWWESLRLGIVAGVNADALSSKSAVEPFQLLNLRTGERAELGSMHLCVRSEHPSKPWLVLQSRGGGELQLFVFDVQSKQWLFEWRRANKNDAFNEVVGAVWFEGDELVFVAERLKQREGDSRVEIPESQQIERWSIPSKTLVATAAIDPPDRYFVEPGSNGRMILEGRQGSSKSVEVVGTKSLKAIFSTSDLDEGEQVWEEMPNRIIYTPRMPTSGRTILSRLGRLWSIDENRVLWRKIPEIETHQWYREYQTAFRVEENWTPWLRKLHIPFELKTVAVRDLETASVLYRAFHLPWGEASITPDPIPFDVDGTIYRSLPSANWPLLAVCQSILALPLVLLWTALRWRKRRKASAAAIA